MKKTASTCDLFLCPHHSRQLAVAHQVHISILSASAHAGNLSKKILSMSSCNAVFTIAFQHRTFQMAINNFSGDKIPLAK
jgi:hypothetical protein